MCADKKKKAKPTPLPDAESVLTQLQHEIDAISAREDWSIPAAVVVPPLPADAVLPDAPPPPPTPEPDTPKRGVGAEEKRLIGRFYAEQLKRLGEMEEE